MRLKSRLAVRMNEAKLMAQRCDSSSNFSVSSVESGGGTSSSFSGSVQSEDGEAWSPPRQVQQRGGSGKEAWSPLCVAQSGISETEMMKERFSRLLLGEDMSGSGKGVSTALAISNGITNLYASIFGELGRLEALPMEKKEMWRREMDWFLSVTDHIVEMTPSYKTFPDGTKLEIMTCKQRSDLFINLPALRKLDSMLIELFEGFSDAEFWYIDQGKVDVDTDGSVKILERQKEKWWLPVPQIPEDGLSIDSKRQLLQKRECAVQILKAALLINTDTISEMEVPDSYLETLPKTGKACLGDQLYRFLASDHFSVESVFDCLDLSADHVVSELVNRLEAAINLWRKRSQSSLVQGKSSSAEAERKELFSGRAEDLLLALKHQFHHLPQTTLEATKIQCNKDIGKSILESYSRVLESLAYNMVARIDDLQSIDTLANNRSGKFSLPSTKMTPPHHTTSIPYSGPLTRSPSRSEIVPFLNKLPRHSNLAKRVLANYLCSDSRSKNHRHSSKDDSSVLAISNPRTDTVMPPRGTSTELSSPRKS